ncbi:hypothetical protein K505DRAFT_332133 [Melanomma pulvis-pyrius CBS 109.77]|uniref:Uncharacterized protein n=1 Tax=Melanomma pulvis-pyrius CBS 109.77 TaxID=1314802 RepID=A0A6A6XUI6_9PLEO|nr:hypothetical protein K505DRAFT_332133 [Melanomma pulvis-pyrius CBS 109.77]
MSISDLRHILECTFSGEDVPHHLYLRLPASIAITLILSPNTVQDYNITMKLLRTPPPSGAMKLLTLLIAAGFAAFVAALPAVDVPEGINWTTAVTARPTSTDWDLRPTDTSFVLTNTTDPASGSQQETIVVAVTIRDKRPQSMGDMGGAALCQAIYRELLFLSCGKGQLSRMGWIAGTIEASVESAQNHPAHNLYTIPSFVGVKIKGGDVLAVTFKAQHPTLGNFNCDSIAQKASNALGGLFPEWNQAAGRDLVSALGSVKDIAP